VLQGSTGASFADLITATFGAVLVYGETGWTALGPATAGYVLTTGGTGSLPYWSEPIAGSGSGFFTFSKGFTVSLNNLGGHSKTFGKYVDGDYIPSTGWTLEEFIYDVVTETKAPTVYLNITNIPKSIEFGATGFGVNLSYGYTLTNIGATVVSGILEWSTDPNSGFVELIPGSSTSSSNTLTHTISFAEYETPHYYYKYTVTDSIGGVGNDTDDIAVLDYVGPSITLDIIAKNINATYGETNLRRQYGNPDSDITFSYTRNSPRIDISTYTLYNRVGSGVFTDIYGPSSVPDPASGTVNRDHTRSLPIGKEISPSVTTSLSYRVDLVDEVDTISSNLKTMYLEPLYFFGPVDATTWQSKNLSTVTRADLLSVASSISRFQIKIESAALSSNKFTFQTGTTYTVFIIAIPNTKTISSVVKKNTGSNLSGSISEFGTSPTSLSIESADASFSSDYKIYRAIFGGPFTLESGVESYMEVTIS